MSDRSISAGGSIDRSVVVSGDGNTVSLRFGPSGPVLPVERRQIAGPDRRRRQGGGARGRELDILDPARGRLPLLGRGRQLAALRGWLDDGADISVHCLTGPAGIGKTRLAIGFCAAVDGGALPGGEGWLAGFLSPPSLPRIAEVFETAGDFDWAQSTLLVIDDAAQCHEALGRWLDRLAAGPELEGVKLRILLLERQAPEGFGWWHDLCDAPASSASGRRDLFWQPRPDELAGLADLQTRRQLLAAAMDAAANLRGAVPRIVPDPGADAAFDARLAAPAFANALSLVMAGVIGHEQGLTAALSLRRLDAARHLGARELDRFARLAAAPGAPMSGDARAMRHLLAFNGMAGGLPVTGLGLALQAELAAIGATADTARLADLLQQELPPAAGAAAADLRLATIRPDLIGEAVIVESFAAPPARQAEGAPAMRRAYGLTGTAAAKALMQLLQDYAYAVEDPAASDRERETGERLLSWLHELANSITDPDRLEPLAYAIPAETLVLREAAAGITWRMADACAAALPQGGAASVKDLYRAMAWSGNLAQRLNDLGEREAALAASVRTVALARGLFEADARAYGADLARSLTNHANYLARLEQREAALVAGREAVQLYRNLAAARPNAFRPDVAGALNNLSLHLSSLGLREEALATANESVELARGLVAVEPAMFRPKLARSLTTLASHLGDEGKWQQALLVAQEAVEIRRDLAAARPDAFTPALAGSLVNLANCLITSGQREEALVVARQAVQLFRDLAATRPDAFGPDLAGALSNLADRHVMLGQWPEAIAAGQEAVDLWRNLDAANPDAFRPNLAGSLTNLARGLAGSDQPQEALAMTLEATGIYRDLANAQPDAFQPNLAISLGNLANRLMTSGRPEQLEEALIAAQEAVAINQGLAAARPDAFQPDLATSLNSEAAILGALQRHAEALGASRKAVGIFRDLATTNPAAFAVNLSISLWNLADQLIASGDKPQALDATAEAITVLAPVSGKSPGAARQWMQMHQRRHAGLCDELGRARDENMPGPINGIFTGLQQEGNGNDDG